MKTKLIFFLTALLIMASCSESKKGGKLSKKDDLPVIKIRPPEGELPDLKLSEIAEDIKYIKLETTDDCLIGESGVHYSKDSKYIFINFARALYQFDTSGKFIRKIGRKGKGPNEFILQRLAVDFKNKILYVNPLNIPNTILRFDFDGKPLEKITNELLISPNILTELNSQLIYANNPGPFFRKEYKGGYMQLLSFNPQKNKINFYLPNYYHFNNDRSKYGAFKQNGFSTLSKFKNKAYYWCAYKDTMYQITSDTISPYIIMDLGKYKFNYKNREIPRAGAKYNLEKVIFNKLFILDIMFTNKHILFNFFQIKEYNNFNTFLAVYNRNNKKVKYYNNFIPNDLDGGFNIQLRLFNVSIHSIDRLRNKDDQFLYKNNKKYSLKFPERKDELKKLLDNSKIEDNPIITILKIRDDF